MLGPVEGVGGGDVRRRQADEGQDRYRVRMGGEAHCEIDVATSVGAAGRIAAGEGVGLPQVGGMLQSRVERRTRRVEVEAPQVDPRRHASNAADIAVAAHVHPDARLAVASGDRRAHRHVLAEGQTAGQVVGGARWGRCHQLGVPVIDVAGRDRERHHVHDVGLGRRHGGRIDRDRRPLHRGGRPSRRLRDDRAVERVLMDVEVVVVGGNQPGDAHRDSQVGIAAGRQPQRVGVARHALVAGRFVQVRARDRGAGPAGRGVPLAQCA